MTAQTVSIFAVLLSVLLAVGWYLSYTAVRLDRLHTRLDATAAALDVQVVRRAECAIELAYAGGLDPAGSALVLDVARASLEQEGPWTRQRREAESAMTAILRRVLADGDECAAMQDCALRVRLARRFHNEAVDRTRAVRRRPVVRALRLAGHTDLPEPVDFDDDWPGVTGARAA
ncbi:MAG TPA: hypothetical protein VJ976_05330 [Ornithinimicrobium sp.]|uniref:hypothetical protein n=1 Tax=Ornithinimicrobium sp. TaxID=1977084 RepID=UPI002B4985D9|nr:hypothetical protein [Ornithinimicrobium sp.]HKJ11794.1 hypothetical protein [Ornithinimicrobium sp.]